MFYINFTRKFDTPSLRNSTKFFRNHFELIETVANVCEIVKIVAGSIRNVLFDPGRAFELYEFYRASECKVALE